MDLSSFQAQNEIFGRGSKVKIDALVIDEKDNVAIALRDISSDEEVIVRIGEKGRQFLIRENIPFGHKFAIAEIRRSDNILKYGEVIGRATTDIGHGSHVHTQNVESLRARGDLK